MPRVFRSFLAIVLIFCVAGIIPAAYSQSGTKDGEWRSYGGAWGTRDTRRSIRSTLPTLTG